ncbi:MAG: amidohydrolase family protein [Rhodospirillales bacterium]|nr:amidohydrolase family protein [Rhodospirillales bacterium]
MEPGRIYAAEPEFLKRQLSEEILVPELPIIDAHMHLWLVRGETNEVLSGTSERYMYEDYLVDAAAGHNIIATVYTNGRIMWRANGPDEMKPVGEVEYANGVAAMAASGIFGPCKVAEAIIGSADLAIGDAIAPMLEASIAAGGGRYRGARTAAGWDEDSTMHFRATAPGLYRSDGFRAGLKRLFALGLSFEALVFHTQLADVLAMARENPDATIIVGHCGSPVGYGRYATRHSEVFAQWRASLAEIAQCQNVSVKLGGLMLRSATLDYPNMTRPATSQELADAWRPYIETCIELFGPDRCMFESNFPVERMGVGFVALWNAYKRLAMGASDAEKAALFAGTARRVYRLKV